MSREREWQKTRQRGEEDEHEALWQALADRICPIDSQRPGGPQRIAHQDLPLMDDDELVLELRRAIFRSCLERDSSNRYWLRRRIAQIGTYQVERGLGLDSHGAPPPIDLRATAPASVRDVGQQQGQGQGKGQGQGQAPAQGPAQDPVPDAAHAQALARIAALEREIERVQHEAWLLWKQVCALRALPVDKPGAMGWHEITDAPIREAASRQQPTAMSQAPAAKSQEPVASTTTAPWEDAAGPDAAAMPEVA